MKLPDNFIRIYPLLEDGSIDSWYFTGDGDQMTDEMAAADYASENPDVKFVEVVFAPVSATPWSPEVDE